MEGAWTMSNGVHSSKESLTPWAGYHKALRSAEKCRRCFLRSMFSALGKSLKAWIGCPGKSENT